MAHRGQHSWNRIQNQIPQHVQRLVGAFPGTKHGTISCLDKQQKVDGSEMDGLDLQESIPGRVPVVQGHRIVNAMVVENQGAKVYVDEGYCEMDGLDLRESILERVPVVQGHHIVNAMVVENQGAKVCVDERYCDVTENLDLVQDTEADRESPRGE